MVCVLSIYMLCKLFILSSFFLLLVHCYSLLNTTSHFHRIKSVWTKVFGLHVSFLFIYKVFCVWTGSGFTSFILKPFDLDFTDLLPYAG
jgi:hypothetical protein